MPGFNKQGPNGEGAMTGRRMGRCNPNNKGKINDEIIQNQETSMPLTFGLGCGLGRGFGRGIGIGRGMAFRFRGNR